jgi:hypothetical protein
MLASNKNRADERYVAAFFRNEENLLAAVTEARERDFEVYDVFTPFPVHGMDDAMGLRPSRLSWIAFIAGVMGLAFGLGLQIWTSVYDWPLNIGGKPFNSFPLFVPVAFELTVLFSGLIAIGVLFAINRLWILSDRKVFNRVTDDRFVLVLRQSNAAFDKRRAMQILTSHGAIEVIEGDQFV